LPSKHQQQRDTGNRMGNQQRQVENCRHHRTTTKRAARKDVRDGRPTYHTNQRRSRGSKDGQNERLTQLGVAAESRESVSATGKNQLGNGCGEKEQQE